VIFLIKGGVCMFQRLLVATLFLCGCFAPLYAAEAELENTFSGLIELGGDKTVGNSDNSSFNSKLELGHAYGKWSSKFTFDASQKKESGALTEDKYNAILKSIYDLPAHFYTFVKLGYREDNFSGVYYEKTYIGGFGYHAFTAQPKYSLDFELGYGQRITKKIVNGFVRAKLDYDPGTHVALITQYNFTDKDTLKASITEEIGNDDDYIKKEISWVHKLFDALQMDISYVSTTLTKPGVNKVATDATTTYKLGYEF
jgi:putative salt-induced outer membrane protein YdiY